jgi:hypothetical protein
MLKIFKVEGQKQHTFDNLLHIDGGHMNMIWRNLSYFHNLLHLSNRNLDAE